MSRSTIKVSLRLVQTYRQKTSALRTGLWLVGHTCSKPASQECSRRVMCEAATSNALHLRSGKAQSQFPSCIKYSESKADIDNLGARQWKSLIIRRGFAKGSIGVS